MKKFLTEKIQRVVESKYDLKLAPDEVELGNPPKGMGDFATNVAMRLAGRLKRNPREIAQEIGEIVKKKESFIEKFSVEGPGFLNFFLQDSFFSSKFFEAFSQKETFGLGQLGKGRTVMIEFGQPNTHKAFHVGHLRSAISGLSLAKIHELAGYRVVKVNYYGDVGMHVAKATWGVKKLGLPAEFETWDVHQRMAWINKAYVVGAKAFSEDTESEKEIRKLNLEIYQKTGSDFELYEKIKKWSLEHLEKVFAQLGIEYDKQYPESEVFEKGIELVEKYKNSLFFQSDGAWIYKGKEEGLTDWVFLTSEGNATYSAKDLALALQKFKEFNPDFSIITTSIEQIDYFKVIIRCVEKIDPTLKDRYIHVPFGWLLVGGKKTSSRQGVQSTGMEVIEQAKVLAAEKISERAGNQKEKKEVVDRVALAGLKFLILSHEFHSNINYDPKDFIKLEGFSGPFVLYSLVRANSVLKKVKTGDLNLTKEEFSQIPWQKEELVLMKKLLDFPESLNEAVVNRAPHLLCRYVYDLAKNFNLFYDTCQISNEKNQELKSARAALLELTVQVLTKGLEGLGIEAPDKM